MYSGSSESAREREEREALDKWLFGTGKWFHASPELGGSRVVCAEASQWVRRTYRQANVVLGVVGRSTCKEGEW